MAASWVEVDMTIHRRTRLLAVALAIALPLALAAGVVVGKLGAATVGADEVIADFEDFLADAHA